MAKNVMCKRCGEVNLAWVKSKKTGRFYLAPIRKYHGMPLGGDRGYSRGGEQVVAHQPHKCDPARVEEFQAQVAGYAKARGVTVAEWFEGK